MTICATILWLESRATCKRFPVAEFSGDTDMVTAGWVSLTSVANQEVVVARMTADEYEAGEPAAYRRMENRINAALCRDDLRASWLVGVDRQGPCAAGLSFQEFQKVYQPPRLLYRDILAEDSQAEQVGRVSLQEFQEGGGRLICHEA